LKKKKAAARTSSKKKSGTSVAAKGTNGKGSGVNDAALRKHVIDLLKGGSAHVQFLDALEEFPPNKRGTFARACRIPAGNCWSIRGSRKWDIVEFSRNAKHVSPGFPEGYWPKTPGPVSEADWEKACSNSSTTWTRWLA